MSTSPLLLDIVANKGTRWSMSRGGPCGPHTSDPRVVRWTRLSAATLGVHSSSVLSSLSVWRLEGGAGVLMASMTPTTSCRV